MLALARRDVFVLVAKWCGQLEVGQTANHPVQISRNQVRRAVIDVLDIFTAFDVTLTRSDSRTDMLTPLLLSCVHLLTM